MILVCINFILLSYPHFISILKAPPAAGDKDHDVRVAFMVPLTETCTEFTERFGADVYTIFNMTEISSPIVSEPNPSRRGTCVMRM